MRTIVQGYAVALVCLVVSTGAAAAGELLFGCCSRPACGKMCKLVCDTTSLVAVGYGCKCEEICIPGPSRPGCKHCSTTCCCDSDIEGCPPKIEFCWYDWFACGCAKPRQVRVLTKYQAEKEICSYHWEVVDGCACGCGCGCCASNGKGREKCRCVYKPAPAEAEIGEVLALTEDEQVKVTSWMSIQQPESMALSTGAGDDGVKPSAWERVGRFWGASDEQK